LLAKVAQDLELGCGQGDAAVAALHAAAAPGLSAGRRGAAAVRPGVGQVAVGSPQQGLDAAHQLAQPERLVM